MNLSLYNIDHQVMKVVSFLLKISWKIIKTCILNNLLYIAIWGLACVQLFLH